MIQLSPVCLWVNEAAKKEKLKEHHKEYWKENSEKFKQKKKLNKEHIREVQRAYFRKNPEIKRMSEHKRRAIKNNLPKDLSIEQWEEVKAYLKINVLIVVKKKN